MSETVSLADWNVFISALLSGVFILGVLIWAIDDHCGSACEKCRKPQERKHL